MGNCMSKVRSTFFCLSCKKGFNKLYSVLCKELHGIPHYDKVIAEKGYWACALYCPGCNAPLYTRVQHLIREQKLAFKRWNAKRKVKNGKTPKIRQ